MDKTSYMTCEVKVDTQSSGWHKTITKILDRVREVSYTIDIESGTATISGRIEPKKLLRLLEKAGKHVEILKVESGSNKPYEPEEESEEENYVGMIYNGVDNGGRHGYPYPQYSYPTAPMTMMTQPVHYENDYDSCSIM